MPKTVLILSNHFITLFFFRKELIARLIERGHKLYLAMPYDERQEYFEALGCEIIHTPMSRRGMNPVEDFKLMLQYKKIMKELKPDIVLSYTIKPNIYGSMASNALGLRQLCNVTGTGATFIKENLLSALARTLYRLSLPFAYKVYFQNTGDRDYFIKHKMVRDNHEMLPGSGVNLSEHRLCTLPAGEEVRFIYIGRVMAVKGVEQYLDCARAIKEEYPNTKFYIAGFIEEERFKDIIEQYEKDGYIEYLGFRKDIDDWIRKCHCTVLPSLGGEGVPNVLLESAASGRPCIASNINGSREVIDEGHTGYLYQPGDSEGLIACARRFMGLSHQQRENMGRAGREKMEKEFNREIVIEKYIREVER